MSEATLPGPAGMAPADAARGRSALWRAFAARGAIWIVLLALVIISSIVSPVFMTSRFISTLLKQAASLGIVAVGQTLAILTGGIDLSVASVMALMSVLASHWMNGEDRLVLPVTIAALAVAALIGLANGLMVTKLKIPAFIATIGMILIVQGARFMYTGGTPKGSIPDGIKFAGGGMVGPVPAAVIVWAIVVAVFFVLTRLTVFGRRLYASGGNPRAAHLSGVNVTGVIIAAYTLCSLLAGVAGLVRQATPGSLTTGWDGKRPGSDRRRGCRRHALRRRSGQRAGDRRRRVDHRHPLQPGLAARVRRRGTAHRQGCRHHLGRSLVCGPAGEAVSLARRR
jgi:ribose/xylose/arabinose/galactoside ABC-type transport system permease subunit